MLKVTLTVEMNGASLREAAGRLTGLADILDGGVNQAPAEPAPAPTTEAPKRGRPPKAVQAAPAPVNVPVNPPAPPAPAPEPASAPDDLSDLGFEPPKPAPAPKPGFTLENVIQLCKDHAGAKGLEATRAILKSFGVSNVRDLKPEQFEAVVLKLRS